MKKLLLSLGSALLFQPAYAHEGHPPLPGQLSANHGGVVLSGKEINLEYVTVSNELENEVKKEVKLFPLSHDGKELTTSEVKITVTAKAPKGKAETLKIETKEGAMVLQVNLKDSYRVELNVNTEVHGKKDSFKFQVEK